MDDDDRWPEDDVDLSPTDDEVSCSSCGASGPVGEYVEHEPDCAKAKLADEMIGEMVEEGLVETGSDDGLRRLNERDREAARKRRPSQANPGLLRGPAMNAKFGDDLDEDELDHVGGTDGEDLDRAMSRYETFHAKQPIRITELEYDIPTKWVCTGDGLSVMYKTDKWHKDGDDEEYKHLHGHSEKRPYQLGKGVRVFEPSTEIKRSRVAGKPVKFDSRVQKLPVAIPKALTLLGYCMGLFVRHTHDGEVYEVNPRGSYLFCSPRGDLLLVYSPTKQPDGSSGFLCAMAGGSLRVLKDGIDG